MLAKRSRYLRANVRKVHEMRTTTVTVCMRIGIYTVCKLRDNTVAMGLRFLSSQSSHEESRPIRNLFFLISTVGRCRTGVIIVVSKPGLSF